MNTCAGPVPDEVAEYVAKTVRDAPKLTARQLDRLAPLLRRPQTENLAAA